jgi:hypothetical protein
MIREYLGRVSVAATKVLPKGDRLLFVGRTRAAIEAKVGPIASADADAVVNALTSLGDPDELVKQGVSAFTAPGGGPPRRRRSGTQQGVQAVTGESRRGAGESGGELPRRPRASRGRPRAGAGPGAGRIVG